MVDARPIIGGLLQEMSAVVQTAADLLMPLRCAGCDLPGTLLCDRCACVVPRIDGSDACPRCGAPDGNHGCAECGRSEFAFARASCFGVYEWPLSRAVTLMKDAGELRLVPVLAQMLLEAGTESLAWADVVVPMPASPGAVARRGFDHGGLLAAEVALLAGLPGYDALYARPRRDQRALTREQRGRNAAASVACAPGAAVPRRILLVDDVMTTGATADAAARALLAAGAREVRVLTVARACGGRL